MEFKLSQLIIHELTKEAESPEATLFLSQETLPLDERSHQLVEKLNDIFDQKSDTLQGFFSSPEDALFPGYFQDLVAKNFDAPAFVDFSRESMQALQLSLQGVTGAKGGYLVYALYEIFDVQLLGIFLIRDTEGVVFQKEEDLFSINPITYLNTDKLAMAGRIDINKFSSGNARCLELIKHTKSQKTISEYFINWIGLDQPESSRELTKTFLNLVEELPLPKMPESDQHMTETEFKEEVMNFAMSRPHKTLKLEEFDQQFYGEEGTAKSFVQENEIPLEQEFRFDQNTIKRFFHYRASSDGITLHFNQKHLTSGMVILEDDRIVIHSDILLEKLWKQLD
jgi:nucleoid-associated protein